MVGGGGGGGGGGRRVGFPRAGDEYKWRQCRRGGGGDDLGKRRERIEDSVDHCGKWNCYVLTCGVHT